MADYFEQIEENACLVDVEEGGNELIVYNDDIHTFDYVINCLIFICKLSKEQAVSCTNIIHYKGLCVVKHGSYDVLRPMCIA
ncbi:MAG: ATP-dependent Clp protease adaptor ClpS, partial [Bacteroidota bacterium]|nr:ATP-dependent Clp protease adaptor ClpS [Bacteroidota bacterium]